MEVASGWAETEEIQDLKDLTIRHPIDHKRETIEDKILKLLAYGVNECMKRQLKLGK